MPDGDDIQDLTENTDEQVDQGMRDASDPPEHVDDEIDSLIDKSTTATDNTPDA